MFNFIAGANFIEAQFEDMHTPPDGMTFNSNRLDTFHSWKCVRDHTRVEMIIWAGRPGPTWPSKEKTVVGSWTWSTCRQDTA